MQNEADDLDIAGGLMDLSRKETALPPIKDGSNPDGSDRLRHFVLKQPGHGAKKRFLAWKTATFRKLRIKTTLDGKVDMSQEQEIGADTIAENQKTLAKLLAICLWERKEPGKALVPVTEDEVNEWPDEVVERLAAKAQRLTFPEEASKEAGIAADPKPSPSATANGSGVPTSSSSTPG